MTEADRKAFEAFEAFEEWCERERVNPAMIPVVRFAWMDSRDHYRKQVAELVEAVDELMSQVKTHSASSSVGTGPMHAATITDLSLLVKLKKLAAKLKEQQ